MQKRNIEIVEKLQNGKVIIKVVNKVPRLGTNEYNTIAKYALADENELLNLVDLNNNWMDFQFFDYYKLSSDGEIIIGIKKAGKEYCNDVLAHFDLSDAQGKVVEVSGGPFNLGPYAKQYYDYIEPVKTVDDIVPKSYGFNYGLLNEEGKVVIYPCCDYIELGNENTCIVGKLSGEDLLYGYVDISSGKFITPVCFSSANKFYDNRAVVEYKRRFGYIDRNKVIDNPMDYEQYAKDLYPRFFRANDFKDGMATACIFKPTHLTEACYAVVDKIGIISIIPKRGLRLVRKKQITRN